MVREDETKPLKFDRNLGGEISRILTKLCDGLRVYSVMSGTYRGMPGSRIKFYNSIRFKLSAVIAGVIFCAVAALSGFSAMKSLDRETENFRALTTGAASAYAAAVADAVADQNEMAALSFLRGIRDLPNIAQTDITFPDGEVFVELGSGAWLVSDQTQSESLWTRNSIRLEIPIVKGGEEIAQLGMLADIKPLRADILNTLYVTLFWALGVVLLGICAAQVFVSELTRPLRKLTDLMSRIRDADSLQETIDLRQRRDETGLLTQTFSDMIDTIRQRDRQIAQHVDTLEDTVEERTRDLRVARDEAEAANAAKSDFLATMSHEIRTPMNGMMVMAEMLGAADLTPRHKRYADIIHRSGNSLLTIINDILDLSKIEAGQLDLELIPLAPERLVNDVTSLFWEKARASELELATYVSPRVPAEVIADPTRLNQVISNLVNNALKFTESGGVLIQVDAEPLESDQVMLKIKVIDTGIGIPADKIDHIFESFSQADQSTTRKFGGTGLGLTVCKRLVTAMDGKIWATSDVGKGSIFHVEFPTKIQSASPTRVNARLKVGLALPDGVLKLALGQTLEDHGCELTERDPNFWISSSSNFVVQDGPVVLLSDLGDTRADSLLNAGDACDVISNPFSQADLVDLLHRAQTDDYRGIAALNGNTGGKPDLQAFHGLRVLAVDDNAVNREVLREALSTLKADAAFAEDGQQALECFESGTFDIVLMDGSMPVMDGFESTRLMREFEAANGRTATPIFALTAQVAGTSEAAWHDAGADGHILKPFTLEKLSSVFGDLTPEEGSDVDLEPTDDKPSVDNRSVGDTDAEKPANDAVFDFDTIEMLEGLGGEPGAVRDRVWNMFFEKAPGMLEALGSAAQAGGSGDVASSAHAFKSMALSAGFKAIAEKLQAVETDAKSPTHKADGDIGLERLMELIETTRTQANQHRQLAA